MDPTMGNMGGDVSQPRGSFCVCTVVFWKIRPRHIPWVVSATPAEEKKMGNGGGKLLVPVLALSQVERRKRIAGGSWSLLLLPRDFQLLEIFIPVLGQCSKKGPPPPPPELI